MQFTCTVAGRARDWSLACAERPTGEGARSALPTARQVRLNLGGSVYDPNDAVGRLLFNVLAMVAEFESDLIRLRTREA